MKVRYALGLVAVGAVALALAACGGSSSNQGYAMMRYGPGMMGYGPAGTGTPVSSIAEARSQAQHFASRLGLRTGEVMHFASNYYAELNDKRGSGATEVLINPSTGAVWFEYGPAMMWNTQYGMLGRRGFGMGGGMMGGAPFGDPSYGSSGRLGARQGSVTPAEARTIANRWLAARRTGMRAGEAEEFPGYYTLHILRVKRITGMLSVNSSTGTVWYHWWHGRFLGMEE